MGSQVKSNAPGVSACRVTLGLSWLWVSAWLLQWRAFVDATVRFDVLGRAHTASFSVRRANSHLFDGLLLY